jgi:hypothetical protein
MKPPYGLERPPISRELRKQIEAEREWIEHRSAEKRRLFFALMGEDVGLPTADELAAMGSMSVNTSADRSSDDPYARFVPVGSLIGIDDLADAVSEDCGPVAKGALK